MKKTRKVDLNIWAGRHIKLYTNIFTPPNEESEGNSLVFDGKFLYADETEIYLSTDINSDEVSLTLPRNSYILIESAEHIADDELLN